MGCIPVFLSAAATAQAGGLTVAPGWVHEHWTTADGLPVNSVNAVVQGRDGYIWLATYDGLVRFDGARFTVFNSATHPNLPSNRFNALVDTEDGTLWLATEQHHLIRFQENQFTVLDTEAGLPHDDVTALLPEPDGSLLIGTRRGIARYHWGNVERVAEDEVTGHIFSLLWGPDKTLWIGTDHEVIRLEGDGDIHRVLPADEPSWAAVESLALTGLPATRTSSGQAAAAQAGGSVWIGTAAGISVWKDLSASSEARQAGGVVRPLPGVEELSRRTAFDIVEVGGIVWLNTDEGVYGYRGGQIVHRPDPEERNVSVRRHPAFLDASGALWLNTGYRLLRDGQMVFRSRSQLFSIIMDREGNVWVPAEDGLHRLRASPFEIYRQQDGLRSENVYPIFESSDGTIWLGTLGGGLVRIREGVVHTFGPESGVPDVVWALEEDTGGTLWVGGTELCRFEGGACSRGGIPAELANETVRAIHQREDGSIWFGTSDGLYRLESGEWHRFTPEDGVPPQVVRVFLEGKGGELWMGTNGGGIVRFDEGTFTTFTAADGLCSDLVRALHLDNHGALWVGTEDRGLCHVNIPDGDLSRATVIQIDQRHGLYDHGVHRILDDGMGRLWMSGNKGIWWVTKEDLNAFVAGERDRVHSTAYTERAGLPTREANGGVHPAGIRASDGRLWFPTQAGAVVFDPRVLPRNELRPPVHIEEVAIGIGEARRAFSEFEIPDPLTLGPGERQLEVVYTAPSFIDPSSVQFRYRLEGFDEEWVEAGTRRLATYTNLRPGTYRFQVIAANEDGVWNEAGATFDLRVRPHWYETRTFLVLCAVLLLAIGLVAGQWRRRELERRRRELETQVEERTEELQKALETVAELDAAKSRFFSNISHEFRTPLTVILGGLKDTITGRFDGSKEQLTEQCQTMLRNTRQLQGLVDEVLDLNRLESGHLELDPRPGDLARFLRRTVEAHAPLAERHGIDLTLDSDVDSCPRLYDAEKLEKIVGNLLSNALKFTPKGGFVRVSLSCLPAESRNSAAQAGGQETEIAVSDDGPGIPVEMRERVFERFAQLEGTGLKGGSGIGLALARELVELHGGKIGLESTPGKGSTFTVRLPLEKASLDEISGASQPTPDLDRGEAALAEVVAATGEPQKQAERVPEEDADRTAVLIIEDNDDVRAYIRRSLEESYRVFEAADGEEGLQQARTTLPDLIVSDVMLPGIDGYEVARQLKAAPDTECIPVVMLTARAAEEDQAAGYGSGAEAYITKPFSPETLQAACARLIEERNRLRRWLREETSEADEKEATNGHSTLLGRARVAVLDHLYDEEFGVGELAAALGMSPRTLQRRLRQEAGLSPGDFLRVLRLERANRLLSNGAGSVSEVAYAIGFKSLSHFTRSFQGHYGKAPSSVLGAREN